jgi:hypothetical protein
MAGTIGRPRILAAAVLGTLLATPGRAEWIRADGTLDWTRYHDSAQSAEILRELEARFPDLARVVTIGKSYQGRDLLVLELTNRRLKAPEEKPGYYVDGGIHATELTGSEVVLYLAWHLATRYGRDAQVTHLLDTRTLYLRPKFNPDGSDYALAQPGGLRSTVRPWDEDGDGRLDEDPSEDLDGDGAITLMRVAHPQGTHRASALGDDPRLLVTRGPAEVGEGWERIVSEGIDNDGDGEFNEDGVGGIDMNRNFPRTWGLPYLQPGAGPYPLSEPETRATIEFLVAHPNITGLVHNHTAGGFLYRLPSTDPPESHEAEDLELVRVFGEHYTRTTGHPVHDSYEGPGRHRYGTLISWAYFDYGVLGWVPEHWGGFGRDYDADGKVTDTERLRWNDEELGGQGFAAWKPYDHPQLGRVLIGGWRRKFTQTNPPPRMLEAELALKVPWLVYIASVSPLVRIAEARSVPLGGGLHRIEATVENDGFLPTHVTERALVARLARPVRATLSLRGAERTGGEERVELGHLPGRRSVEAPGSFGGGAPSAHRRQVSWVVRATGPGTTAEVRVVSEKGGTDVRVLALR